MKNKFWDLSLISTYRTEMMGVAAIGIWLCHMDANGVVLPRVLRVLFNHGNECVDTFLFLSGVGMFYSLSLKGKLNRGGASCLV